MNSHIRVNIEANFAALSLLMCSAYKVLIYLANRADKVGRCWPSVRTIADGCSLHEDTVEKALKSLETYGYICYLRKNAYDPILEQKLPNVYQVSPYFLELSADNRQAALDLWAQYAAKISPINQQQNHVPLTKASNQGQKQQQQGPESKPPTENRQPQEQPAQRQPRNEVATTRRSAIVKKYTNPISIIEALPDGLQELLAERINGYGIPRPMARGFVFKYGYETVHKACSYFEFVRAMQDIAHPGGFFRSVLEHGTADADLPEQQQLLQRDYSGKYAELDAFIES